MAFVIAPVLGWNWSHPNRTFLPGPASGQFYFIAVQAMDEEGTLEIRLQQVSLNKDYLHPRPGLNPGPFVKLSVRDDGVGIDQDAMACIFDPFFTWR